MRTLSRSRWNEDILIANRLAEERKEGNGERGGDGYCGGGGWFRGMDTTGLYGHGNGYSAIACNPISTDAIYPIYHTLLSGALSTPAAALDRLTLVLIEFAQRGAALRAFRPAMFFPGARGTRGKGGERERLTNDDDDDDEDDDVRPASREEPSRPGFFRRGADRENGSGIVAPMDKRANRVSETEKVSDN